MSETRVPLAELESFVASTFRHLGAPADDATTIGRRMVAADVHGMRGHGVIRLPSYISHVEAGSFNLRPTVRIVQESPSTALLDGDDGMGHVVVTRAVEEAIARARTTGLAWVGVRRSNHAGAAGVYAAMALEHDLIAIYLAVGSANHLPPWGGVEPLLSTNPVAIAIPAREEPPILLDMATTVASYGKVKVAAERGEPLPEGWMVDRRGRPLTDPALVEEGFLAPIGGHKGYGLGLVFGMLAGVLNGASFGRDVVDFNADHTARTNTGQTVIVVRPDLFQPLEEFTSAVDRHVRDLRTSTPVEGGGPVRVPGDQLPRRRAEALAHGVPVSPSTRRQLVELADRLGVAHPFDA